MKKVNPTILVVDDDPNDLMFVQAAFTAAKLTATIQTAKSGEEAIAYLTGKGKYSDRSVYGLPDFVITDLKMPGADGFDVLECVKNHPDLGSVPTFILSGSQDNDDIKKAYGLGATSYHVKPGSHAALRALVKTLHDFWTTCEFPAMDAHGKVLATKSGHKLGERFSSRERLAGKV